MSTVLEQGGGVACDYELAERFDGNHAATIWIKNARAAIVRTLQSGAGVPSCHVCRRNSARASSLPKTGSTHRSTWVVVGKLKIYVARRAAEETCIVVQLILSQLS